MWDAGSEAWLRTLPHRVDAALRSYELHRRTRLALDRYAAKVRRAAPRSALGDPHMGEDWEPLSVVFEMDPARYFWATVGSRLTEDSKESLPGSKSAPFNIPWGVHQGTAHHTVCLWNPRTNVVRRKLAQYVLGVGAPVSDVPALQAELRRRDLPPFVDVHVGPKPWMFGPGDSFINELAEDLLMAAADVIGEAWRF